MTSDEEGLLQMRMQRPLDIDLFPALVAAAQQLQIASNGPALLIVHFSCPLVADPAMRASASRVDPQQMLETKVFSERHVNDLDGHGDKSPALLTDASATATRANLVVVRHVNIKDQLFGNGAKGAGFAHRLAVSWIRAVHGANLESCGCQLHALLAESVGRDEGLVADVGVVGQDKGEFAVAKVGAGCWRVIKPLEEVSKGKEALIKGAHRLGI